MATMRVRRDVQATVADPETGAFVYLDPRNAYSSTDPLVKAHPWAFTTDAEVDASDGMPAPGRVYSHPVTEDVEQATAGPGEKRVMSRPITSTQTAPKK
jgi:hypothetical protein